MKIKHFLIAITLLTLLIPTTVFAAGGFDEYGYNDNANIFNGLADGSDRTWGNMTGIYAIYANDKLVMKWNEKWDECNDAGCNDEDACAGAWTTNEYNGMFPGGSGETWHYKFIWVGSEGENSSYWAEGGYSIWGNYEVIMDHGTFDGEHMWFAHATPAGLGN